MYTVFKGGIKFTFCTDESEDGSKSEVDRSDTQVGRSGELGSVLSV